MRPHPREDQRGIVSGTGTREDGWPKGVDQKKQKAARTLKQDPRHSVREICAIVGISRNTYYYKYTRADDTPQPQRPRRPAPSGAGRQRPRAGSAGTSRLFSALGRMRGDEADRVAGLLATG